MVRFNASAIARHVGMLHRLAKGKDGKLVLAAFGEGLAEAKHFDVGDIVGMTRAALAYEHVPGVNVYAPLALMRANLPDGKKGAEEDVIAVLGAVVDSDADKGNATPYPPVQANYVIETSPGNFQHFLLFDKALTSAEAKPFFEALKRATRADGASDLSHVWRIPGCANWPNGAKLKRGRSLEPFLVRAMRPWNGGYTSVEKLRAALELYWQEPPIERTVTTPGKMDLTDVAGVVAFLTEQGEFSDYEPWVRAGMAIKLALGGAGFEIWNSTFNSTVTSDVANTKWASFDSEPKPGCATILSLIARARELGWHGSVRKSTAAMFDEVVASATASVGVLGPTGLPMLAGQSVIAELGRPIVEAFVEAQQRFGHAAPNALTLPDSSRTHPLYDALNSGIALALDTAKIPKLFRAVAVADFLAVLSAAHHPTFDTLCTHIRAHGCALPESRISAAVRRFESAVERELRTSAGFALDNKGSPEAANSDNVAVFMKILGVDLRYNGWTCRPEIRWRGRDDWAPLQDKDIGDLLTTAENGQYRFRPREGMFKRALLALARETLFDPVIALIAAAEAAWDGTTRVDTLLSRTCGVTYDQYHRAVSLNLLGGIVKRARHPGIKHDEVVILIGPQGCGKSNLTKVIALDLDWHSDTVTFEGSPQNVIPQLFGKLVIELSELDGMHRREVQHIKRFLSTQSDAVTLKYEAFASDHKRRGVFVGTSNDSTPLRDLTGNRRFLPVHVVNKEIDIAWLQEHIMILIGEAAHLETTGADFSIPREVWSDAAAHQEAARSESELEILFEDWFGQSTAGAAYITAADLTIRIRSALNRSVDPGQYGHIMRRLGFVGGQRHYIEGVRTRAWCRGAIEHAKRHGSIVPRSFILPPGGVPSPPTAPDAPETPSSDLPPVISQNRVH